MWGRVYGPVGTEGCYQLICSGQIDTGGGVSGRGHAGSWVSCAEREQGCSECWTLESCFVRKHLKKAGKKQSKDVKNP